MSCACWSIAPPAAIVPSALLKVPRYCGVSDGRRASNSTCAPWIRGLSKYAGESDCIALTLFLRGAARLRRPASTPSSSREWWAIPWAPVHKTEEKSLTLSGGDFDYRRLCALLFSGDWEVPLLARGDASGSEQMLLVAEALARGNAKTKGFRSRVLPIPGRVARRFLSPTAATLSQTQMHEIEEFDKALRTSLALLAARGDRELLNKDHYVCSRPARSRFNQEVDRLFFASLWRRVEAAADRTASDTERTNFLAELHQASQAEFDSALRTIPCPAIYRPRAEARARRQFRNSLWRSYPELFEKEEIDAVE